MPDLESTALHRRRFLKGAVVAGGAVIAAPAPFRHRCKRRAIRRASLCSMRRVESYCGGSPAETLGNNSNNVAERFSVAME
jgi:hypothetical protein